MIDLLKWWSFCSFILVVSCNGQSVVKNESLTPETDNSEEKLKSLSFDNLEFIEIEGCEYVVFRHVDGTNGFGFLAHKGNCKNPIHCRNDPQY